MRTSNPEVWCSKGAENANEKLLFGPLGGARVRGCDAREQLGGIFQEKGGVCGQLLVLHKSWKCGKRGRKFGV